ncbi:hypothetical protein, partial [Aeromonas caviae]|uniref:hypothetical protein n=1 Tax=Aeromonas caviae TaxID=648 RepID=UPI001CC57689
RLLTTAIGRHEADGYLAQRQPHPAALSTPLMPGLIGMWLITSCRSANNIMPITIFLPAGTASFFYSA